MHPVLFSIDGIHIYAYGLFVAAGIFLGSGLFVRECKRYGIDSQVAGDVIFNTIIFGVVISRVFYILVDWNFFISHPVEMLKFWRGGFVFYGAILGGFLGFWYTVKRKNLSFAFALDLAAPFIPLSHAIGRIGCFFAGCCYGKTCHLPWAIVVKDPRSLSPLGIPLHPVQLYSSAVNALIFILLYFVLKEKKRFHGELILEYFFLYGIARFFLEFYRGDKRPMVSQHLSYNQLISLILVFLSLILIIKGKKEF